MADVLSQHQVDSLLDDMRGAGGDERSPSPQPALIYRPYDFRHPDRVSKDLERSLKTLHDNFARSLSTSLSGYLRLLVQARVVALNQLSYGEFIDLLPNPTVLSAVSLGPSEGSVVMEISLHLMYLMLDRLMGGEGVPLEPIRELTAVEQNISTKTFDRILELWRTIWEEMLGGPYAITPSIKSMEMVPQMVQVVAPSEIAVTIGIEIRIGKIADLMNICLPFLVVEPILARSGYSHGSPTDPGKNRLRGQNARLFRRVKAAPLRFEALLGRSSVPLRKLQNLQPGDTLTLDRGPKDPIELWVHGRPVLTGSGGVRCGMRAVAVREILDNSSAENEARDSA